MNQFIALLALLSFSATAADDTVSLLVSGGFHGEEVSAKNGERWLGLAQTTRGFAWQAMTIQVRKVHDPVLDAVEQATGKAIAVSGKKPILLVKGLPELAKVRVRGAFYREQGQPLQDGRVLRLAIPQGTSYRLQVLDPRKSDEGPAIHSRLMLKSEFGSQVLYEWPMGLLDQRCELVWAGDLDGDEKLDLFLKLSDHYNVTEYTLFLSSKSKAKNGKLVDRVAHFKTHGC
ncbi:MAG: hypothetical protein NW208_16505 [Bryobacter sp.]|nr:hypothetical protein [Bryobacter sp.]